MPTPTRPTLLVGAVLSALALTASAHAAPVPQITDAAGDAVVPVAGTDIVSVLFGTAGTTTKVRKRTVYTPKKLTVAIRYAGAVSTEPVVAHAVSFDAGGCGAVYLEVYATEATYGDAGCLVDSFAFSFRTDGDTLTMTLPFGLFGKSMKAGTKLTALRAYTALADPAIGLEPVLLTGDEHGANDVAASDVTYVVR